MSFPRYPKYKDSGVEWLGEVPEHWEVTRLSDVSEILSGYPFEAGLFSDEGLPVVRMSDFGDGQVLLGDTKRIASHHVQDKSLAHKGDFLLGLSGSISNFAIVREQDLPCAVNQRVAMIRVADPAACLVGWFLQSPEFSNQIVCSLPETTIQNISIGQLRLCKLPKPAVAEQAAINGFLDSETAKIDELVAEQRRLMELLKEKRQAVISHAVTKGLNPHAPMKPSGIEWLGEVPAHWGVFPLKRDLAFLTSGSRGWAENYSDEGDLFLRIANLTRDSISLDLADVQRVVVPEGAEGQRTRVQAGDVLFSITAYLGSVAVVPDALETAFVSQHVALARLTRARTLPRWIGYIALSVVGQTWFQSQSYGGTKIQLSLDDVKNLPITEPPLTEQEAIVAFIDREVARFDSFTAQAERAIDLLHERRTALISAAVTGQIDVRQLSQGKAA